MRHCLLVSLLLLAACHNASPSAVLSVDARWTMLRHPELPDWSVVAPDTFRTAIETTKGTFVIETYRAWAPIGADRFFNFARAGFFDDSRFFRVVPGYIAQFGVPGILDVTAVWNDRAMRDDPPRQSNVRGTVAYAMRGPNDRRTQIYININDNRKNDADGFAIFGRVVEGMDVVDKLNAEYGDTSGGGMRAGKQQHLLAEGNVWLDREYPRLDHLIRATVQHR
ncbi:MAG: peptidylprolyl isomerase [bacterium]